MSKKLLKLGGFFVFSGLLSACSLSGTMVSHQYVEENTLVPLARYAAEDGTVSARISGQDKGTDANRNTAFLAAVNDTTIPRWYGDARLTTKGDTSRHHVRLFVNNDRILGPARLCTAEMALPAPLTDGADIQIEAAFCAGPDTISSAVVRHPASDMQNGEDGYRHILTSTMNALFVPDSLLLNQVTDNDYPSQ